MSFLKVAAFFVLCFAIYSCNECETEVMKMYTETNYTGLDYNFTYHNNYGPRFNVCYVMPEYMQENSSSLRNVHQSLSVRFWSDVCCDTHPVFTVFPQEDVKDLDVHGHLQYFKAFKLLEILSE